MNTKLANELEGIEAAIRAACDDMTRMGTLSAETWCNLRNAHRDVKCLVTGGDYIPKPLPAISNLRMWGIYNTTDHVWIVKNDIWGPRQAYYSKNGITIYHGDCREVLPSLEKADLVLTDPPYGIGACNRSDGGVGSISSGSKFYGRAKWDLEKPDDWTIKMVIAAAESAIVWGGNYFALPASPCWLVWDKGQRDFTFADAELAWTNLEKAVRIFTYPRGSLVREGKVHPTQKPLPLMKWCIEHAGDDCKMIIDPFMGSGTTLRAAKDLGIAAIGIEADESYCAKAVERLAQEVLF